MEGADARRHVAAEPGPVEDAVMADVLLLVMHLELRRADSTQRSWAASVWPIPEMSSFSPSTVMSADAADRIEPDRLASMLQQATRQRVFHEHGIDRLEIKLGREVHDGEIFVVEVARLLGRVAIAADEMFEHVDVGIEVPVEIHRHETGKLQEAGIDLPSDVPG